MGLKIYIYIYFYYNYFLNAHNRNCSKAVGPSCEDETSGYYLPTGVGISVCTQKPSYPKIQCLLPDLFLFFYVVVLNYLKPVHIESKSTL